MEITNSIFSETLNCKITSAGDSFCVGNFPVDNTGSAGTITTEYTYPVYNYYWDWYCPNYHVHYEKSKIDVAFRIMKVLGDKKIIDMSKLTVGKFILLVNEIAKEV